jgi:hypothetical protein
LTNEELVAFEKDKLYKLHLEIRGFDDQVKSTEPRLLKKIKDMDKLQYLKSFIVS